MEETKVCLGIKETSIIPLLLSSLSSTELCLLFFIEEDTHGQDVVYRSRRCDNKVSNGKFCFACQELFDNLNHYHHLQLKKSCTQFKYENMNVPKKSFKEATKDVLGLSLEALDECKTEANGFIAEPEADKTNFEKVSEEELIYNVCDECGEIFENQDKLTKHSLNHRLRENIVIKDIPETIDKQDVELKEEDIKIEEDKNKKQKYHHAARVLSEVIKKNKDIAKEKKQRKKEGNIEQCPFCPKIISKLSIFKHVTNSHWDEKDNPTFQEIMNRRSEKKHICSECGKDFQTHQGYTHHFYKDHQNILKKEYLCTECGQEFFTNSALLTHVKNFHEDEKSLCIECNKMYPNRQSFRAHIRQIHTNKNQTICNQCGKTYNRSSTMYRHVMLAHSGERKYSCDECPKVFAVSNRLTRHKTEIHMHRAYGCEQCAYKAATASNLNMHRRKMHQSTDQITRLDLIEMIKNGNHPYCDNKFLELLHKARDDKLVAYEVK